MVKLKLPKRRASLDARRARSGYLFALPFILGIFLIYIPVLIDSIWFSLNETVWVTVDGNPEQVLQYVGFEYYTKAFANTNFITALLEGIQQLIFEVPAVLIFSLFIAVVLNQKMLGRAAFRAIFFVPVIISTGLMETVNAMDIMDDAMAGGINDGSGAQGGGGIISALDVEALFADMNIGGDLVTYVVDLVNNIYNIVNYSGVQMLIFLAGLQSISPSIYEACRIDGATGWETFWKVTFPMISPMILVNAVYTMIDAFTRTTNPAMSFIESAGAKEQIAAMGWIYFVVVILLITVITGVISSFIFYQRRD